MQAAPPTLTLDDTDLSRLETALLDALLDVNPGDGGNAVDRLLNDPSLSPTGRERVERFLAAAVMETGPARNRLLDEMLKSAPLA